MCSNRWILQPELLHFIVSCWQGPSFIMIQKQPRLLTGCHYARERQVGDHNVGHPTQPREQRSKVSLEPRLAKRLRFARERCFQWKTSYFPPEKKREETNQNSEERALCQLVSMSGSNCHIFAPCSIFNSSMHGFGGPGTHLLYFTTSLLIKAEKQVPKHFRIRLTLFFRTENTPSLCSCPLPHTGEPRWARLEATPEPFLG